MNTKANPVGLHLREDSKRSTGAVFGLLLIFIAWVVGVVPLIDSYYIHSFEADSSAVISYTEVYHEFFHHPLKVELPRVTAYPPYFDGAFIVYALGIDNVRFLRFAGLVSKTATPTSESITIYTIRHINALCHLCSALVLFQFGRKAFHNVFVSFAVSFCLLFSIQILQIDFLRIDHLILCLFVISVYLAFRVANNINSRANLVVLALVCGFLVTTKITSFVLLTPVLCVLFLRARKLGYRESHLLFPALIFVVSAASLSSRYLIHPMLALQNLVAKYEDVKSWEGVMSRKPLLYYLWDLPLANGFVFTASALISGSAAIFMIVVSKYRTALRVILGFSFGFFTLASIASLKYPRGGYHLVPIYALCGGILLTSVDEFFLHYIANARLYRAARVVVPLAFICLFVKQTLPNYTRLRVTAEALNSSIDITREQPIRWLQTHVSTSARIVIPINSEWAMPPLDVAGYTARYAFLAIPYLDRDALAKYPPPTLSDLKAKADVILLNDFHPQVYLGFVRKFGLIDTASQWEAFYNITLKDFPTYRFVSETPCYGVSEVRIIIINGAVVKAALPITETAPPLVR